LDGDDLAAFVVAALGADAVRKLRFMALRTGRKRLRFEEVMGTARTRAGLGMASFGIRHWRVAPELVIGYRLSVTGFLGAGNRQQTTGSAFLLLQQLGVKVFQRSP